METIIIQKQMTLTSKNVNRFYKNSIFEAIYICLDRMQNRNFAPSKYQFSTNGRVQHICIKNGLIEETTPESSLNGRKQPYATYYKITEKGIKFIKMYEQLRELVI